MPLCDSFLIFSHRQETSHPARVQPRSLCTVTPATHKPACKEYQELEKVGTGRYFRGEWDNVRHPFYTPSPVTRRWWQIVGDVSPHPGGESILIISWHLWPACFVHLLEFILEENDILTARPLEVVHASDSVYKREKEFSNIFKVCALVHSVNGNYRTYAFFFGYLYVDLCLSTEWLLHIFLLYVCIKRCFISSKRRNIFIICAQLSSSLFRVSNGTTRQSLSVIHYP